MRLRNPLIWLRRIRHRCGYGVHSPFAFDLITQVLYSPGRYYAYERLDALFSAWARRLRVRRLAVCRLLFRLANRWQPEAVCAPGAGPHERAYLAEGCRRAAFVPAYPPEGRVLLYLDGAGEEMLPLLRAGTLLVVDHLPRHRALWQEVLALPQRSVAFDLHEVGIAFFDPKLQKELHVVNW